MKDHIISRTIVEDTDEMQVQKNADVPPVYYYYRKDYMRKGDQKEEYSMVLMYAKQMIL